MGGRKEGIGRREGRHLELVLEDIALGGEFAVETEEALLLGG